jgi:ribosome-binding factor A
MSSNRPEKIADLLKKEVSLILSYEVKDPRLQNMNITAVKVTDDISIAYVYYTIIGKPIKKNESKVENNVLIKLSGMLRSKISKLIEIRRVPKIIFKFDESIEYSENIEKLLKNIK